jgi:hypothetical protein
MKTAFYLLSILYSTSLIAQTQRMGVNTSTPSATLDVQSQGNSAQSKALSVSNSNQDTLMLLLDNGNLGIGTTQPQAPIDVQTSGNLAARFSAPVEGQPAVNANELVTLGQLQAVSAGGQGGSGQSSNATMWSTSTQTSLNLFSSLVFCRNLNEGGFTDWRLPTLNDVIKLITDDAVPLPSYSSGGYWMSPVNPVTNSGNSLGLSIGGSLSSTNTWSFFSTSNSTGYNAFCVR